MRKTEAILMVEDKLNSSSISKFALGLTNNEQQAEELIANSRLKLANAIERWKYCDISHNHWWLVRTTVYNTFVNDRRKKKKSKIVKKPLEENRNSSNSFLDDNSPKIEPIVEGQLSVARIFIEIDLLDENLKVPFMLHYEWYKYQEIADLHSLPIWTVKSRIFAARKILKEKINKNWEFLEDID